MRSLASNPGPVLADVRLVIWTLKTLKETYSQNRTLLETQIQNQVLSVEALGNCSSLLRCFGN